MLKIRLRRVGRKGQPSYRIVVSESTVARGGKYVEALGFYNPRTEPQTVTLDEARTLHWLSVGAQPSDSAARLLKSHGTLERFARLRGGESVETLVAEAIAAVQIVSPKTKPAVRDKAATKSAVEVAEAD